MIKVVDKKDDQSFESVIDEVDTAAKKRNWGQLVNVIQDDDYWKLIKRMKDSGKNGWTEERTLRHVAHIPAPMYYAAVQKWGEEIFRDRKLFKKYFCREDTGEWTLTVPKDTL